MARLSTIPADTLAALLLVFRGEETLQASRSKIEREVRRAEKRLSDPSTPLRERVALRAY